MNTPTANFAPIVAGPQVKHIADTYLIGTSLRLRKVEAGIKVQYKLTQKKEDVPSSRKGIKKINTLYLARTEFEKLCALPGFKIEKTRYIIEIDKHRIAIDSIQLASEKLLIAEVEFETEGTMNTYSMPLPYKKEVTNEPEFSGFEIAKRHGIIHP